jgi:DNA gyrase subunit A
MKLDEGDSLIGVATCRDGDDLMLATKLGRTLRCQITDETLRVFAGRDSSGVRGIKLAKGDEVISLSVLRHIDVSNDERMAYLKVAAARRRASDEEEALPLAIEGEEIATEVSLSPERIAELDAAEEILLTVTDVGFGKRTSAYEYRVMGRGGQGIGGITLSARTGHAVAGTFTVREGDGVMMVTDAGRLIRVPSDQVRITGRMSMGVTLFRLDTGERVTSVFSVVDDETPDEATALDGGPEALPPSDDMNQGSGDSSEDTHD